MIVHADPEDVRTVSRHGGAPDVGTRTHRQSPYLWLRRGASPWLLAPALGSLSLFAWLLTLHPAAAGRVYAAYGGVYVAVAMVWLWKVDQVPVTVWDIVGAIVAVSGMMIIVLGAWKV